jgi:glutamate 5-kinase
MIKNILTKLASGEDLGTFLYSDEKPLNARKQWLMGQLKHSGDLIIDAGASKALQKDFVSLLPVGVKKVLGTFNRGELVRCIDDDGVEVARGLINYSSSDARNIIGFPSSAIVSILGYEENLRGSPRNPDAEPLLLAV